jgi:hypothetical protein
MSLRGRACCHHYCRLSLLTDLVFFGAVALCLLADADDNVVLAATHSRDGERSCTSHTTWSDAQFRVDLI